MGNKTKTRKQYQSDNALFDICWRGKYLKVEIFLKVNERYVYYKDGFVSLVDELRQDGPVGAVFGGTNNTPADIRFIRISEVQGDPALLQHVSCILDESMSRAVTLYELELSNKRNKA